MDEMTVYPSAQDKRIQLLQTYAKREQGYFYILEYENGLVKVGSTADPFSRAASLFFAAPTYARSFTRRIAFSPAHTQYLISERFLHGFFPERGYSRVVGTELFSCTFEDALRVGNAYCRRKPKESQLWHDCMKERGITIEEMNDLDRLMEALASLPEKQREAMLIMMNGIMEGMKLQDTISQQAHANYNAARPEKGGVQIGRKKVVK